jgi:hypothetical protein
MRDVLILPAKMSTFLGRWAARLFPTSSPARLQGCKVASSEQRFDASAAQYGHMLLFVGEGAYGLQRMLVGRV